MKTVSSRFKTKETKVKKRPTELYHIWRDLPSPNGTHWRYTSGDVAVTYAGLPYVPATLNRSLVIYDSTMQVSKMTIYAGYLEVPIVQFIAMNPVEQVWIQVMRAHRDIFPLQVDVIFVGQIKAVSFKGLQANVECVGFEHFLSMPIPTLRYQVTCNWKLFETRVIGGFTFGCGIGVTKISKKVTAAVTLDSTGRILTSATFGLPAYGDGYFTLGTIEFGDEKRTIVSHVGNVVTMAYKMRDLVAGNVDAYPGCDGRPETCKDKFNNVVNSLWFAFIPQENPAIRIS